MASAAAAVRHTATKVIYRLKRGDKDESKEVQKDLFSFRETAQHGFPSNPSAIAYDESLDLLAIGTQSGELKVVGKPGVVFSGFHGNNGSVKQLFFLADQGRIVSLTRKDNKEDYIHLWEVNSINENSAHIQEVKQIQIEEALGSTTTCCIEGDGSVLYIGTSKGNLHVVDIKAFTLVESKIVLEAILQNVPDDYKANPGCVQVVSTHPLKPNKILIGFSRGLIVLWDNSISHAEHTYVTNQPLEDLAWHSNGAEFSSVHVDGSLINWTTAHAQSPHHGPSIPYGPFPCNPITKLTTVTGKCSKLTVFIGGMPRASYGDRNSVTVMQGRSHVAYDLPSKVIDFVVISVGKGLEREPKTIFVLTEEELICIDLTSEGWPVVQKPYLNSVHFSPITYAIHYTDVNESLWDSIATIAGMQGGVSNNQWPITGGKNCHDMSVKRDILISGHENGNVCIWAIGGITLSMLYKINTGNVFVNDVESPETVASEEWPPFRKVGDYDPYSDDPRLAVQKIALSEDQTSLIIAGTSGHILVYKFNKESSQAEIKALEADIVGDTEGFVWKGHQPLTLRSGSQEFIPGFQPVMLVQSNPPAMVTALAVQSGSGLVSFGTGHGFAVVDLVAEKVVLTKCTLEVPSPESSEDSKRKTLKQTLRESFRRIRKKKSPAAPTESDATSSKDKGDSKPETIKEETKEEADEDNDKGKNLEKGEKEGEEKEKEDKKETEKQGNEDDKDKEAKVGNIELENKEVKQVVEEDEKVIPRSEKKQELASAPSMIRFLFFSATNFRDSTSGSHTLWAGTNSGQIFIFDVGSPDSEKRSDEGIIVKLSKELKLKHRAPVIGMSVVDKLSSHVSSTNEASKDDTKDEKKQAPVQEKSILVVCSEEQIKQFELPSLKPRKKYKFVSHGGAKCRKIGFVKFVSSNDDSREERCMCCLDSQGNVAVYSLDNLKQQMKESVITSENVAGITSCLFTSYGEGFYLLSSGVYQRFSLSAKMYTEPQCILELNEGMRPKPDEKIADTAGSAIAVAEETATENVVEETQAEVTNDGDGETSSNIHDQIAKMKEEFLKAGEGEDGLTTISHSSVVVSQKVVETTHTTRLIGSDGDVTEQSKTEKTFTKEVKVEGDADDDMVAQMEIGLEKTRLGDHDSVIEEDSDLKKNVVDKQGEDADITLDEVKDHLKEEVTDHLKEELAPDA